MPQTRSSEPVQGFAAIPIAMLDDDTLSVHAKMSWLALSSFAGYSEIRPGQELLARRASISTRAVRRGLDELRERGLVEWQVIATQHGRQNIYRLLTPWDTTTAKGGAATQSSPPGGVRPHSPDGSGHTVRMGEDCVADEIDRSEVDKRDITPTSSETTPRRKAKRSFPDGWQPTDTHRTYAREHDLDIPIEAARFESHHRSKDSKFADWDQAFWTWLRNQVAWNKSRGGSQQALSWGPAR